jgi:hypothetical protein
VLDGFSGIAAAWRPILARAHHRLTLSSVFCHSRPHVCFDRAAAGGKGRCELADLLIAIDYQGPGAAPTERRAVLVQAKLLKPDRIRLGGDEWVQYELLSTWPSFEFADARYDPRARLIRTGGMPELAGEYGGIALGASPRTWTQYLTSPPKDVDSPADLGGFLARMPLGAPLCGRPAVPLGDDDWSFTVRELLEITANLPVVKADDKVLRGNVQPIGFMVGEAEPAAALMSAVHQGRHGSISRGTSGGGGGGAAREEGEEEEWPEGAISTVHLRISHVEAQPEG